MFVFNKQYFVFEMEIMVLGVFLFQVLASIGLGAFSLYLIGLLNNYKFLDQVIWSFALGYGILGWLLFFLGTLGHFSSWSLFLLLAIGCFGLWVLIPKSKNTFKLKEIRFTRLEKALFALLSIVLFMDIIEAITPPADADSTAYHYAIPKFFLEHGQINFIYRAVDGAIPLLNQMTYIPVLKLGGERAMTFWAMASGWGAAGLLYSISRQYLCNRLSLCLVIIYLTIPAVVYGAGTGQVEARNAMFVILGAVSIGQAIKTGDLRYTVLAGAGVGFFLGGKYIGLFFALACGVVILFQKRWFLHGITFGMVSVVFGGQWYFWNFIHTGDPVFPMLFNIFDYKHVTFWTDEQHRILLDVFKISEQAVPANFGWLLMYPFFATLMGFPNVESRLIGFGPYLILIFPFLVGGVWKYRRSVLGHSLFMPSVIITFFYIFWFLIGSSQRIRHLLPILPLVLLTSSVAAERWMKFSELKNSFVLIISVVLFLQVAGHALFSIKFLDYNFGTQTRAEFLMKNVRDYELVNWVNSHLKSKDKLLNLDRQLNYFYEVPFYYAHPELERVIDIKRHSYISPGVFYWQLNALNITHLALHLKAEKLGGIERVALLLTEAGCLKTVGKVKTNAIISRTLGPAWKHVITIFEIQTKACDELFRGD